MGGEIEGRNKHRAKITLYTVKKNCIFWVVVHASYNIVWLIFLLGTVPVLWVIVKGKCIGYSAGKNHPSTSWINHYSAKGKQLIHTDNRYILLWLKILLLATQSCLLDHLFHLNIVLKMSLDMPFQVCDVFCKHAFDIFFLSLVNDGGIFQWFITVH